MKALLSGAAFVMIGFTAVEVSARPLPAGDLTEQIFGTETVQQRMMKAQTVTAARAYNPIRSQYTPGKLSPIKVPGSGEPYTMGESVKLNKAGTDALKKLLAAPESYEYDMPSACIPDYGVIFTFGEGADAVRMVVCFQCHQFLIFDDKAVFNKTDNLTPMTAALIKLCKELFPKDARIQALEP